MKLDWLSILIHGTIALTFGIMRELHQMQNVRKRAVTILANGMISLFVGVSVFFLCRSFAADDYLTAFFTSISGWIGGSLMDFFETIVKKIIEKKTDDL